MSDSSQPHGLWPTRLLRPWDFPGKNTEVGFHFLLQEIFLTQGLNPGLQHCRQTLYQGSLRHVSAGEISHVLGAGCSNQDLEGTHSTGSGQDDNLCSCRRRWSIHLPQTDWTFFMTQHSSGTNDSLGLFKPVVMSVHFSKQNIH